MINVEKNVSPSVVQQPCKKVLSECALVFSSFQNQTIITKHAIINGTLQDGFPVDGKEVIEQLQEEINPQQYGLELIPENVIVNTNKSLVWYCKAEKRPMWFRVAKPINLTVTWPALLFWLDKSLKTLHVYALGTNQRPNKNTNLYRAPVMNTNSNGCICLGSAKLPKDTSVKSINMIENCLFESYFTHLNSTSNSQGELFKNNQSHIKFWRKKQQANQKVKVSDLPFYKKLSQLPI